MYDLVVLGGGAGGLNVATAAARVGAKVGVVETARLGGECIYSACIPSKALIEAARRVHQIRTANALGIKVGAPEVDFAAVMARVRGVVADFSAIDTGESLRALGIDVYRGSPAFEAYDTLLIDGTTRIHASRFVIATGSRAAMPNIPGLAGSGALDNVSIWNLNALPASLIVIGSGPTGLEMAQAFARLGSKVTVLSDSDRVLPREDPEVSDRVAALLAAEGIAIQLGVEVTGVSVRDGKKVCAYRTKGKAGAKAAETSGTHILVAAGRLANVEGLNLEAIGIHADPEHGVEVDEYLQTHSTRILAIGDVTKRSMFTHAAKREAAIAFQNAVLRIPKKMNFSALPWATFIDPEVAAVGLSEPAAREKHGEVLVFRADYADLDRARIDGRTQGFAKVIATPSGKILGASVVGEQAALVLQELVIAMEHGLTLSDVASTVHPFPTYADLARTLANQFAATKLERPYVQTALRWFLGYKPRTAPNGTEPSPSPEPHAEPAGHHGH